MTNFCHRTNLKLIDDEIKAEILDYVNSAGGITTSHHDFPLREKYGGTLVFYKVNPDLSSRILRQLPSGLHAHDPYIRVQVGTGCAAVAHVDGGRKSGIFIPLSNDRSETKFYDWLPDAKKNLLHEMVVDPEEIIEKMTVIFGENEHWLFNHASIHSIADVKGTRISLNILFKDLEYNDLLAHYINL